MDKKKNKFDNLLENFIASKDHITLEATEQFAISALSAASLEYEGSLICIQAMADRITELEKENKELSNVEYNRKVKIPKVVADWVSKNKERAADYEEYTEEDALSDSIHFTIYGLFANYPNTNTDVELRKPVLQWLEDDRANYFKLVEAVKFGYEVEEEPKWVVINKQEKFFCNMGFSINKNEITNVIWQRGAKYYFDTQEKAEAVALLVGGEAFKKGKAD